MEAQESIAEALNSRFGMVSSSQEKQIRRIDSQGVLKGLLRKAIQAADQAEFDAALKRALD